MKYNWPSILVASLLALFLFWTILFGHRPVMLAQSPVVIHVGSATMPSELGDMVGVIDEYGVHVPRQPSKVEAAGKGWQMMAGVIPDSGSYANMTAPAIGYAIYEWTFLGLPFGWTSAEGNVVYVRNDWGTLYAQLRPEGWRQVNTANGRDVTKIAVLPFWNHAWGWLFVLGLIVTWWLWVHGNNRRREELGLID